MWKLKSAAARFVSAAKAFGSVARVAGAVESGRAPNSLDLETLGISEASFSAIGKV